MLGIVLCGCGYTSKVVLPGDVDTINVEIFDNSIDITKEISAKDKYEIYRPDLEVDLRDAIIERLFLDGHLKISSSEDADAILSGAIIQYRKDPLRYQNEDIIEYRISLVCDITLRTRKDSDILLDTQRITGDSTYFTTGNLQKTETEALNETLQDLARRIVNRIVENW